MNRAKWNNSRIPLPVLAAKFAEEAGEVAGAIADREENRVTHPSPNRNEVNLTNLIRNEIEHAWFLLALIEERVG